MGKTMREQLEESWDKMSEADAESGDIEFDEESIFDEDVESDGSDEPAEEPEIAASEEASEEGAEPEKAAADEEGDSEPAEQLESSVKPPVSWTPANREQWAKLPAEIQQQVAKREQDFNNYIQKNAQAVKEAETFRQATDPYKQFFAAEGVTPQQATANLMQTAAGLRVGTPQQKAAIVREIITNFGVDIEMLDTMLAGQQVASTGQDTHLQQLLQQQLAPVQQFMTDIQRRQQEAQQQTQAQMQQEVEQFAQSHDFFEDLRHSMADITEMYQRNYGKQLTLEEAYQKAADLHPEIGPIMQQRAAAQKAPPSNLQAKKNAASSIGGAPGRTDPVNVDQMSREDTLRAAWDGLI